MLVTDGDQWRTLEGACSGTGKKKHITFRHRACIRNGLVQYEAFCPKVLSFISWPDVWILELNNVVNSKVIVKKIRILVLAEVHKHDCTRPRGPVKADPKFARKTLVLLARAGVTFPAFSFQSDNTFAEFLLLNSVNGKTSQLIFAS